MSGKRSKILSKTSSLAIRGRQVSIIRSENPLSPNRRWANYCAAKEFASCTLPAAAAAAPVVIPQLNQHQRQALARGRTIRHYGRRVRPNRFTLRQRAVYEDEGPRWDDGGGALYTARTQGVLRGI